MANAHHPITDRTFLITGGASLIGSHVADRLLAEGAKEVRLFDNFSLGTAAAIAHLRDDPRAPLLRGDVLRMNELIDAATGVDGVFALAGFLTIPMAKDPVLGVSVNTMGMVNTLEACRIAGARRIVFSSSVATYGNPTESPVGEYTPYRHADLQPPSLLYGASKLTGEALCAQYAKAHGLEFNALRFASVYGERQHARALNAVFVALVCDSVRGGLPPVIWGDGSEVHDYVYVTDVARLRARHDQSIAGTCAERRNRRGHHAQRRRRYRAAAVQPARPATRLSSGRPHRATCHGRATGFYLAGELFKHATGTDIVAIPYNGTAPQVTAMLSNEVQVIFDPFDGLQHFRSGRFRALAVTSATRSSLMPEIPTLQEAGLNGVVVDTWIGMFAPAGTPRPIINLLNAEITKIIAMPEVRARLAALSYEPVQTTPEQFAAQIQSDTARWAKTVKDANFTVKK